MVTAQLPKYLWAPNADLLQSARIVDFQHWLKINKGLDFADYTTLYQWSVDYPADFWACIWRYFDIIYHSPYSEVLSPAPMPHAKWFDGATLNYAENIFKGKSSQQPAIRFASEQLSFSESNNDKNTITWSALEQQVASVAAFMREKGISKGDRVVGYLPNIPQAVIAFLATASIGAIWSSCSPDFGTGSVVDRFRQIEPKLIFAVDGYQYGGKHFDRRDTLSEIIDDISTIDTLVYIPYLYPDKGLDESSHRFIQQTLWDKIIEVKSSLKFEALPFSHPLYILYSSGTTGIPKAITHCHGGILLEHLKYLAFHNDLRSGETFFWFSTTGWMMWNFSVSVLALGATLMLYDGSPGFPDMTVLWGLAEKGAIAHFGTSAPYLVACMKNNIEPQKMYPLTHLRSINSTGSPLPPEAFDYVYKHIKSDVWLSSMSGGTDVCTAWVGGNPLLPVYEGEIQCRCLGCDMRSFDEMGHEVINEVGEMVVVKPMPSMPVFFWNDRNCEKYIQSYFEMYEGIWRHGDWLKITDRGSCIIYGRSDATLNRQGIRIGTSEIYRVMDTIPIVKDALIVNLELVGGKHFMPLFVVLATDETTGQPTKLTDAIKNSINQALRTEYSPRHVPDEIIQVTDIPYTISGKKMEAPVKKILMGIPLSKAVNQGSMRNPAAMDFFVSYALLFKDETVI